MFAISTDLTSELFIQKDLSNSSGFSEEQQAIQTGLGVIRGGSWYESSPRCRSASRYAYNPVYVYNDVGFRVICELSRNIQ